MKKLFTIFSLFMLMFVFSGCSKTDVEEDLMQDRENQELLTDEEAKILEGEDPEFQEDYMRELGTATEEQRLDESIELINELETSIDNKKAGKAKGSCEAIDSGSTCIEYYGPFWTEVQMRAQCEGSGVFSTEPCPSDMAGGCNTGLGTPVDMVAWMYLRGAGEITEGSLKNAKKACDATIASEWIQIK